MAGKLDEGHCRHQVAYLGLLENVRVRRAGFASRQPYARFLLRYGPFSRGGGLVLEKFSAGRGCPKQRALFRRQCGSLQDAADPGTLPVLEAPRVTQGVGLGRVD